MPYFKINANLAEYPLIQNYNEDTFTFGDMHSNPIRLLYCLIQCGAIHMEKVDYLNAFYLYYTGMCSQEARFFINEEKMKGKEEDKIFYDMCEKFEKKEYEYLNNDIFATDVDRKSYIDSFYKNDLIDKTYINSFVAIKKIIETKVTVAKACKIRLLGDLIADRGNNDYFIFLLLKQMQIGEIKLNVEILFSNHDALGIRFLIFGLDDKTGASSYQNSWFENMQSMYKDDTLNQRKSLFVLYKLLLKKDILKEDVLKLAKTYYMPNIKLFSYSIENNKLSYYMHAPNDFSIIKSIYNYLFYGIDGIPSFPKDNELNIENIAKCIDLINYTFIDSVMKIDNMQYSSEESEVMFKGFNKSLARAAFIISASAFSICGVNKKFCIQAAITNNSVQYFNNIGKFITWKGTPDCVVMMCYGHVGEPNNLGIPEHCRPFDTSFAKDIESIIDEYIIEATMKELDKELIEEPKNEPKEEIKEEPKEEIVKIKVE